MQHIDTYINSIERERSSYNDGYSDSYIDMDIDIDTDIYISIDID